MAKDTVLKSEDKLLQEMRFRPDAGSWRYRATVGPCDVTLTKFDRDYWGVDVWMSEDAPNGDPVEVELTAETRGQRLKGTLGHCLGVAFLAIGRVSAAHSLTKGLAKIRHAKTGKQTILY